MQVNTKVSTQFATAQSAHQVGLLISIAGEAPLERPPINLALVLDRSGSMHGAPLAAAKAAARRFVALLAPSDRLTVVTFSDDAQTLFGPGSPADPAAACAIDAITSQGMTNLSGGWLEGRSRVGEGMVTGTNRVVLLTDGGANVGVTDRARLADLAAAAARQGVSTTSIGFGATFDEDLLTAMATAGGANYWYVERLDQMGPIFDEEIEGLVTLAAQNLTVTIRLDHPGVAGVTVLHNAVTRSADGDYVVRLGDLYATSPCELGLVFHVENVGALGPTRLGTAEVRADVLLEDGIEHRVIRAPVMANLDGASHPEPAVERTIVRLEAARARQRAVEEADQGDFRAAGHMLREASARLRMLPLDETLSEEIADLEAEAQRMEERRYDAADRKYNLARGYAVSCGRAEYSRKISRRRRPKA